ncbi:MAG: T9SS type A sorting domain-containing protein [Bacteroidota bacterium]|nr:T9SS type A sorting domain-containing protein [Bacteroidota bacterium]MDP4211441.1 T9SS type A sorting domain-containing protein [Bacteroidota bacterium]MDP4249790.1 T9SS type A sorting domain-containing protein [Bacteroidota bacterium]
MKQPLSRKFSGRWITMIMSVVFVTSTALSFAGSLPSYPTAVVVTKNQNSKRHKIRLFTASDSKTLLFTVDGVNGNQYTLYVFDLEGKLVTQSAIRNHETSILPEINSGGYLYEVFVNDQKVENGMLTVRKN